MQSSSHLAHDSPTAGVAVNTSAGVYLAGDSFSHFPSSHHIFVTRIYNLVVIHVTTLQRLRSHWPCLSWPLCGIISIVALRPPHPAHQLVPSPTLCDAPPIIASLDTHRDHFSAILNDNTFWETFACLQHSILENAAQITHGPSAEQNKMLPIVFSLRWCAIEPAVI